MAEQESVGRAIPRIDAHEKVRGEAMFAADRAIPGTLIAKLLPSPHAHAEIRSIDLSRAEALPGVRAVISAADIPVVETYDPASRPHAFLARRFVVFAGQPVAAVAADDLATAEEALELIDVDYRRLPVVDSVEVAIEPGAQAVSREPPPEGPREDDALPDDGDVSKVEDSPNVAARHVFSEGDLAAAFAQSDIVVEHTYTVPTVHQGYLEPHAVTAHWDTPTHVTVEECVQGVFGARDLIADTLGIPPSDIAVNASEIGGGFGGKDNGLFAPLAVLLARKSRQPVKLVLTRREELVGTNPAPRTIITVKTGARSDGRLTALEARALVDVGAFSPYWEPGAFVDMLRSSYAFDAWHLEGVEVLTNKTGAGPYRAPLAPNAAFAIESQIDEIAGRLHVDPLQFRLDNLVPPDTPRSATNEARRVLTALADHPAWAEPLSPATPPDSWLRGRGLGTGSWGSGRWSAAAMAVLEADGRVRLVLGQVNLSGSSTGLAQIAAEALGVSVDRILMSRPSTDVALYAPVSGGSGTIYSMGTAVRAAALELRANILERASELLEIGVADLDIGDDGVFARGLPDHGRSFRELYVLGTDLFESRFGPLVGNGSALPQVAGNTFVASAAEVAVDPETGRVVLTRLTTVQDVGRAINPLAVEGQIQGGSVQAAGIALYEEVLHDASGAVLNPTLQDYRMPTATDVPAIEPVIVEGPGGDGPYGAKGVGEPPIIAAVPAIANAVAAATGVRHFDLPITPERVWAALSRREGAG